MEIKIKKAEFLNALSFTQNVVEKKSTMPILANVLLETKKKSLEICATDLEVGISTCCAAEVIKEGKVTVFARSLFDIVKELPDKLIHIKVKENNWLEVICDKSQFKIMGMAADEFPSLPRSQMGQVYSEDRELLKTMIEKTAFAMSNDETRYNLNGVFFHSVAEEKENTVRLVATDGHRLSIIDRVSKSKWKLDKGIIIPRKGVVELKKLLEISEGNCNFIVDEKNIAIEKDNVLLVIRLIEGQYPPYQQVIPKANKRVLSVNRQELIMALRRVSILATDRSRGVKFNISPGNLEISTSNPDMGEAREELSAVYKGEKFNIGFNARYFLDVLGTLADEQVIIELKDDVSPCVIRSEFDRGLLDVIMPMRM